MKIELREIRKYFGPIKANDGISLVFESGKIYGLLGENGAGKSTLMKILSGYQQPETGGILVNNQPQVFTTPAEALKKGIGMLYQDPLDIPAFTVKENYLLGRSDRIILDYKIASQELSDLVNQFDLHLDLQVQIENLSLGERQQLELARLLVGGAQVLILDEPTTGISAEQKDKLFNFIRRLASDEGKTIILVSHKLDEVQELCGEAFILRRGKLVGSVDLPCKNEVLVEKMFDQMPERRERPVHELGDTILELRDIRIPTYRLVVSGIHLTIREGEVFGLAGLEGSGQQLVMQACAGLVHTDHGQIFLAGKEVTGWTYHRLRQAQVGYAAAGRLEEGLVAGLSITEHLVLSQPSRKFIIDQPKARALADQRIDQFRIIGQNSTLAENLSGGNQQRLLFALFWDTLKLILLEHPTRGLDVQSADWIWEQLYKRRESGTAILFMSADLDEIIERSDRIAVFSGGVMSRILDARNTTVDEIGHLIGGQA